MNGLTGKRVGARNRVAELRDLIQAPSVGTRSLDLARRAGALSETFSRMGATLSNPVLISGQPQFAALPLLAGQVVTKIVFFSGSTPLAGGKNQWFALWGASLNRLAVTSDDGSAAWAANTEKQLALTTPYTVPADGLYYVSVMVNATTVPNLIGINSVALGPGRLDPILFGRDQTNTGQTGPASAPAVATLTPNAGYPWAWVG